MIPKQYCGHDACEGVVLTQQAPACDLLPHDQLAGVGAPHWGVTQQGHLVHSLLTVCTVHLASSVLQHRQQGSAGLLHLGRLLAKGLAQSLQAHQGGLVHLQWGGGGAQARACQLPAVQGLLEVRLLHGGMASDAIMP